MFLLFFKIWKIEFEKGRRNVKLSTDGILNTVVWICLTIAVTFLTCGIFVFLTRSWSEGQQYMSKSPQGKATRWQTCRWLLLQISSHVVSIIVYFDKVLCYIYLESNYLIDNIVSFMRPLQTCYFFFHCPRSFAFFFFPIPDPSLSGSLTWTSYWYWFTLI